MNVMIYRYVDFDGTERVGECQVRESPDGFCVWGITGPQGCSKIMDPAMHWKPIKAAITDLLGGRVLISYETTKEQSR